jgi:hypothetical protein
MLTSSMENSAAQKKETRTGTEILRKEESEGVG